VEAQASYTPVCLRVTSLCACKHNVEHEEGEKYSEHSDKLEKGSGGNVAVLLLFCRLDKGGKHHAEAKKIADVGKVNVEIPTYRVDIIKDSRACDNAHESERAIDSLIDQLSGSVFYHYLSPLGDKIWRFY
jgi:hypothetical protein